MIDLFSSGGFMMWPLLALAAGVLWLAVRAALRLRAGSDPDAVRRDLHGILFWGGMAVVLGLLGTVVGLVVAMEAIARAGEARASLVWGGVGVSLVTLIFGLLIFVVAAVAWFALRQWHAAVTTAAGLIWMPLLAAGALLASGTTPASAMTPAPAFAQTPEWQPAEERRVGPPSAEFASITDVALDESATASSGSPGTSAAKRPQWFSGWSGPADETRRTRNASERPPRKQRGSGQSTRIRSPADSPVRTLVEAEYEGYDGR